MPVNLMDAAKQEWTIDPHHNPVVDELNKLIKNLGENTSQYTDDRSLFAICQAGEYGQDSIMAIDFSEANYDYSGDEWEGEIFDQLVAGTYKFGNRNNPRIELILAALKKRGEIEIPETGSVNVRIWW